MTPIPFGPNGVPIDPPNPPRPLLFTGDALWMFADLDEYAQWLAENQPIPPPPSPETIEE